MSGTYSDIDTGGLIEYIDMGDYTLEIDNRGPVQQRRKHPKAITSLPVTPEVRRELEDRLENETIPLAQQRLGDLVAVNGSTPSAEVLPPVEDFDAIRDRERHAAERLQVAGDYRAEEQEEMKTEARGQTPEDVFGSERDSNLPEDERVSETPPAVGERWNPDVAAKIDGLGDPDYPAPEPEAGGTTVAPSTESGPEPSGGAQTFADLAPQGDPPQGDPES